MKRIVFVAAVAGLATAAQAQPKIAGLTNNYSFIPSGMPNYGIAQGSIFVIFGENLAQVSTPVQGVPLPLSMGGVSLSVAVGSATTQPILYYISPSQIGAILPSTTPIGDGQITVTVNGQTSVAAPIKVVPSAFGILTINQTGSGPAAAYDALYRPLRPANSAAPGDTIILWGTGLGAVTGDERGVQTPRDLTDSPIQIEIGNQPAAVAYHGRSIYPGLDQINVIVPKGVTPGCYVSVAGRSGDVVSNYTTIPVAVAGGACNDFQMTFGPYRLSNPDSFSMGQLEFGLDSPDPEVPRQPIQNGTGAVRAVFSHYTTAQYTAKSADGLPSLGSCVVYGFTGARESFPSPLTGIPLDAGANLTIDGNAVPGQNGVYERVGGFVLSGATTYKIAGTGGADIGQFSANDAVAGSGGNGDTFHGGAGIATWLESHPSVPRSAGLTLLWTPSQNLDNFVQVSGASFAAAGDSVVGGSFYCTTPNTGKFTVPPTVLLALPASTPIMIGGSKASPSRLSVATYGYFQKFTAPGLDLFLVTGYARTTKPTMYQ
jgi:uncharacterized protein (TIGR03437 family)